jgi:hypothetical protein
MQQQAVAKHERVDLDRFSIRPAVISDARSLVRLFTQLAGHPVSEEGVVDRLAMVSSSPIDDLFVAEVAGQMRLYGSPVAMAARTAATASFPFTAMWVFP